MTKILEVHDKRGEAKYPWSISSHDENPITKNWENQKDHIDGLNYAKRQDALDAAKKIKEVKTLQESKTLFPEQIKGIVREGEGKFEDWF
ncbi:MAG: hypothetical protein WC755_08305 [Candidatus Woesearchaeota archaeon]|jgi:hypothetical protein